MLNNLPKLLSQDGNSLYLNKKNLQTESFLLPPETGEKSCWHMKGEVILRTSDDIKTETQKLSVQGANGKSAGAKILFLKNLFILFIFFIFFY